MTTADLFSPLFPYSFPPFKETGAEKIHFLSPSDFKQSSHNIRETKRCVLSQFPPFLSPPPFVPVSQFGKTVCEPTREEIEEGGGDLVNINPPFPVNSSLRPSPLQQVRKWRKVESLHSFPLFTTSFFPFGKCVRGEVAIDPISISRRREKVRLVCFRSGITASLREEYRIRQIYGSQKNLECNNDRKAYSTSLPTFQRNKGTAHSVQCVHAPCFLFAQCSTVQNIFSCPPHEKSNRTERQFISRPKRKRREQDRCNADIFTLFLKLSGKPIVPDSGGGKQPHPSLSLSSFRFPICQPSFSLFSLSLYLL